MSGIKERLKLRTSVLALAAGLVLSWSTLSAAQAGIVFIGEAQLPGTGTDLSGLTGNLEDGNPGNRLSIGSGFTYNPVTGTYFGLPDRGPNATPYAGGAPVDNTISFQSRTEELAVGVTLGAGPGGSGGTVNASLIATHLLTNEGGTPLTGLSSGFASGLRFDPESIRISNDGTKAYISDEYGPFVYAFDTATGKRVQTFAMPDKFNIANPSGVGANELPSPPGPAPGNSSGRQANRGMESLAISPDGTKLFGVMQNPLIQDGALNASNARRGVNIRIVQFNAATGAAEHEFVYVLGDGTAGAGGGAGLGVNDLVAINDHQFLLIERDSNAGNAATIKRIVRIDITGATDVSGIANLPQTGLPAGVVPVTKTTLLDLLDPAFGLAGAAFPEKIEGLAFGPDLADGRHLLLVTNDNDFITTQPNRILAFAIDDQTLVPEPVTLALFATGLGGLFVVSRRKRRNG